MVTTKPAEAGEPAVWTMTVTVEGVPADRHLEVAEQLDHLLERVHSTLLAAGLGRVREASVSGPAAVHGA